MNVLVLEENERISKIFEKIFQKKNIVAQIVKSQEECLQVLQKSGFEKENVDCIILDKSRMLDNEKRLEDEIIELRPWQKIFFLSPYLDTEHPENLSETVMIIQKPFALIALLIKLELKSTDAIIVKTA